VEPSTNKLPGWAQSTTPHGCRCGHRSPADTSRQFVLVRGLLLRGKWHLFCPKIGPESTEKPDAMPIGETGCLPIGRSLDCGESFLASTMSAGDSTVYGAFSTGSAASLADHRLLLHSCRRLTRKECSPVVTRPAPADGPRWRYAVTEKSRNLQPQSPPLSLWQWPEMTKELRSWK